MVNVRKKAIITGLYLSRFDNDSLKALGFKGMQEAFNVLGYAIGAKPTSIKNYRDEFDPYFPNTRKGWHHRDLREYCRLVMEEFQSFTFDEFTEIIESFLLKDYDIEKIIEKVVPNISSESIAKRLITGKAAEEYFKHKYSSIHYFTGYELKDTTNFACGFDFWLSAASNFYCIEVKGLSGKSGSVSLTEKEFITAQKLKNSYCLFVVTNFVENPTHQLFFNPIESNLEFKKTERQTIQISFTTQIYHGNK